MLCFLGYFLHNITVKYTIAHESLCLFLGGYITNASKLCINTLVFIPRSSTFSRPIPTNLLRHIS